VVGVWGTAARDRVIARWVLLLCTVTGLAMMHTLGHATPGHHPADSSVSAMIGSSAEPAAHCHGGCGDTSPGGPGGHPAAWEICLAIVGGLTIAVLLVVLLIGRAGRRHPPRPPGGDPGYARRAPPQPFGLAVSSVSALRI
jgi:hypothetical protein